MTHTETVGVREELDIGDSLFRSLEQRESEDWSDDDEKEEVLEAATAAASRLCVELEPAEKEWLKRLADIANGYANLHRVQPDVKASALLAWIDSHLRSGDAWNGERVIIFTEYKHTLAYLERILEDAGYGEAVMSIVGGMPDADRHAVNEAFQSADELTPVRVLLATDAASEGADFQKHCRNLVHYEIPWNPVRLEQRNGRIDRHGQRAEEVRVHHFVFRNHEDSEFLQRIVEKVESIRADLGSVGALIAENVRKRALGTMVSIDDVERDLAQHERRKVARAELDVPPQNSDEVARMVELLHNARSTLGISDDSQLDLLRRALELEGAGDGIVMLDGSRFYLTQLPGAWRDCRRYLSSGELVRPLTFNRDDAKYDDSLDVVHLDQPLMRRATAAFRIRMWTDSRDGGLHRVAACRVTGNLTLIATAWGRLVLLGPEHNRLHEGLISVNVEIQNGELVDCPPPHGERSDVQSVEEVRELVIPHLESLTNRLRQAGEKRGKKLSEVLKARGVEAEKHARSLATERMAAIRQTIRKWEKEAMSSQLLLFDAEERDQRSLDLSTLKARLESLRAEREREPKRQRKLYAVNDVRVYPVAFEAFLPEEGK